MGVTVAVHTSAVTLPILTFGTDEQKSRFVPLARGEALGAFALTEPEAGSDAGALRTAATANGDGWSISGAKQWITNGRFAGTFLLFARTDQDTPGAKGVSAFILDADDVKVTRDEEKLGLNSSVTNDIVVEGAEVGPSGFCMPRARASRWRWPHSTAAGSASQPRRWIAQAAYEAARAYALERKQFGKRIAEFQAIQWKLADMATEIDAARIGLPGSVAEGAGPAARRGGREGEAVRVGDGAAPDRRGDPDLRRLRLYEGVPGRAVLPGREDHGDLRRHERDPAARHRALDPGPEAARASAGLDQ